MTLDDDDENEGTSCLVDVTTQSKVPIAFRRPHPPTPTPSTSTPSEDSKLELIQAWSYQYMNDAGTEYQVQTTHGPLVYSMTSLVNSPPTRPFTAPSLGPMIEPLHVVTLKDNEGVPTYASRTTRALGGYFLRHYHKPVNMVTINMKMNQERNDQLMRLMAGGNE